jgi:4'-phosphopantetheinyl transferase EntD
MTSRAKGGRSVSSPPFVPSSSAAAVTYAAASSLSPSFAHPFLKDAHGRPRVPDGFLGSVSHKRSVAVALVARDDRDRGGGGGAAGHHPDSRPAPRGIGVDLEATTSRNKVSVARKVLTPQEIAELGNVPVRERNRD